MGYTATPSRRALAKLDEAGGFSDLDEEAFRRPAYDKKDCPDGVISLAVAFNHLMTDHMQKYLEGFKQDYDLIKATQDVPFSASRGLSVALARLVNNYFSPSAPVKPEHILSTNGGVSTLLDLVAFSLVDPGEGIMVFTPTYRMFPHDLCDRSGAVLIKVPVAPEDIEDQYSGACARQLVALLEERYKAAVKQGVRPKVLALCNPSNPQGRCYARESLVAMARWCRERGLQLLSDEIYALSTFPADPEPGPPGLDTFTSVLSLDEKKDGVAAAEGIHVLYGASKDWGLGGLRLGFLVTRDALMLRTCHRAAVSPFMPSFSAAFFAHLLSDDRIVGEYVRVYRGRLRQAYLHVTGLLAESDIPFGRANGGIFVWLDLRRWLACFDGSKLQSREEKLCRHILEGGVYLSRGELNSSPLPGYFRLVYSEDAETIEVAIGRLAKALAALGTPKETMEPLRAAAPAPAAATPAQSEKQELSGTEKKDHTRKKSMQRLLARFR